MEADDLVPVHHADQQTGGRLGVHPLRPDHGDAVVQLPQQPGGKLLGLAGDHLEFQGHLHALEHPVPDLGAEEAVEQAEDHRLELIAVDKEAQPRHHRVHGEDHPDELKRRVLLPHPGCNDVRPAGGAVAAEHNAVDRPADAARRHRAKQLGIARVVGNAAQVQLVQRQCHGGEGQHIEQAFPGKVRVQLPPGEGDQGEVDDEGEIADAEMEQILQHRPDAVDARRGKGVGKDEQRIVDPHGHGQAKDDQIAAQPLSNGVFHGDFLRFSSVRTA